MASIIIYTTDHTYLDRTIDEVIDKTPTYLLDDIIICNDTDVAYENDSVEVLQSSGIGRSRCWNAAAKKSSSSELVFLNDATKFGRDWLQPLIARVKGSKKLVSPRIHTLDTNFWCTENRSWKRFGWRWDLSLYSRPQLLTADSPAISSNCIVVSADWFDRLGGFDEGMCQGSGADVELSLRSWLFDGAVEVEDDSYIAVRLEVDNSKDTVNNLARIVEMWMPTYSSRFLTSRGIQASELSTGRLSNLMALQDRGVHSIEWFLERHLPELGNIYDLSGIASGKSVAVVGAGPSLDLVDVSWIYRHDLVIAVDYVGLSIDSDYVVSDSSHVAVELRSKYRDNQFVLPLTLFDKTSAMRIPAHEVIEGCNQFELAGVHGRVMSENPPFCNFENPLHAAVNFALFLKPRTISLFGCDNKIIDGKSHSEKIEYYNGGKLWSDSDALRRKFQYFDFGLDQLGKLAHSLDIPLIRINHA